MCFSAKLLHEFQRSWTELRFPAFIETYPSPASYLVFLSNLASSDNQNPRRTDPWHRILPGHDLFLLRACLADLAAARLRGLVVADHYVEGHASHVCAGTADLRHAPAPDAPLDTQALFGEEVVFMRIT